MAKYRKYVDWGGLTRMIESSLCGVPGFGKNVRVEGRLTASHDGLNHDNYWFSAGGQDLVLRMVKRVRPLREAEEVRASIPLEAETLLGLARCEFPFHVPRLICTVIDEAGTIVGLIESSINGGALSYFEAPIHGRSRLEIIAEVAARIHELPKTEFAHLHPCVDSESHVRSELDSLQVPLLAEWPIVAAAKDWILAHLINRPSVVLHGDLLPQNLLLEMMGGGAIAVLDWESARLGDPAFDLAIVTRGGRQPLKEKDGRRRFLDAYNEVSGAALPASAVQIHELLLHLHWLAEAAYDQASGNQQGHGPAQHALTVQAMLRRFEAQRQSSGA